MHPRIRSLILLLALSTVYLKAQGTLVSGEVMDRDTRQPISDVTVYLNGTTIGTTTDSNGRFELRGIVPPCELILSHVSYELQRISITDTSGLAELKIELSIRIIPIQEVTVILDSARLDYLDRFKVWFLGVNYEETGAEILNDSVLYYVPIEGDQFEAFAREPLQINIPYTGYLIKMDLVHFSLTFRDELEGYHCSILGYFYFEDTSSGSRRKQRALARNRAKAYYNSRLHFCRSLYENRLMENGYLLKRVCLPDERSDVVKVDPHAYKRWYSNSGSGDPVLKITDFNCSLFNIEYYHSLGNKPADLSYLNAHPAYMRTSGLLFATDTISIYSTGRVAENSILFSGDIGNKGVAWMFPEDYIPSMQ